MSDVTLKGYGYTYKCIEAFVHTSELEEPDVLDEALHAPGDIVVRQEVEHAKWPGGSQAAFLVCLKCFLDKDVHNVRGPGRVLPASGASAGRIMQGVSKRQRDRWHLGFFATINAILWDLQHM